MPEPNANIDFCGIKNMLRILEQHGFNKEELDRIAARIKVKLGADIILPED